MLPITPTEKNANFDSISKIPFYSKSDKFRIKCRNMKIIEESRFDKLCTRADSMMKESNKESLEIVFKSLYKTSPHLILKSYPNALNYIHKLIEDPNTPESFHVVDIGRIAERFNFWKNTLNEVVAFYAVKVNPDPILVQTLASLGLGFDCASENEMKLVLNCGVNPERIIYSNPRKFTSGIKFAKENGIKKLTFDSLDELLKTEAIYPEAEYIIRIKTDDSGSNTKLSTKFGCKMEKARELIRICYDNKINLIGVNFHVGSNCSNINSFQKALSDCSVLFKEAQEKYGMNFRFLDIGGGWPGNNDELFINMANVVKENLKNYFDSSVFVIAEPGRFFASSVVTLVTKIIGVDEFIIENSDDRGKKRNEKYYSYFLSNGIFQSFMASIYFHYDFDILKTEGLNFIPLTNRENFDSGDLFSSILFGPSCDSEDKILNHIMLPIMKRDDYLYSHNTGAYYDSIGTNFNGIEQSNPFYFYSFEDY